MEIHHHAPIPTWIKVGGSADRLARPTTFEHVRQCLDLDPSLVVLGDGANLIVGDAGIDRLVVDLAALRDERIDSATGTVIAGAGARLPRLVSSSVRAGLAGLEGLGGIPASLGGAILMNAGGAFGEIAQAVRRVRVMTRAGDLLDLDCADIQFGYRESGLTDHIILEVEFALTPADPDSLRQKLKEVMAYKSSSQPLGSDSAGCIFKNPALSADIPGIGLAGERVSAGKLIDKAGCKGLRVGGAGVSLGHANFIVVEEGGRADDVLRLMSEVQRRVIETFGVRLAPEVVVWERET